MGSSTRKRVNLSVGPDDYTRLEALRRRAGFGTVPMVTLAALRWVLDCVESGGVVPLPSCLVPEDDGMSEIEAMFEAYACYEQQPQDMGPYKRHNNVVSE